ncbi:MAG: hypothetical protein HQM09_07105 [Candidatus Riflebacteria bacterium]|nr:hypothetical protein [Candidatus Riflebacteria bacterium]
MAFIGDFLRENANPKDILLAGHGFVARNSNLYTIDFSGLNSRVAIKYRLNIDDMIHNLHPNWFVAQGLLNPSIQASESYTLIKSLYRGCTIGFYPWRIFKKISHGVNVSQDFPTNQLFSPRQGIKNQNTGAFAIACERLVFFDLLKFPTRPISLTVGLSRSDIEISLQIDLLTHQGNLLRRINTSIPVSDPFDPILGNNVELSIPVGPYANLDRVDIKTLPLFGGGLPQAISFFNPILTYPALP